MLHAMGVASVSFVVVFIGFTFHAEGASSTPVTQVIGYLSERTILSCPHKVSREDLMEVIWNKEIKKGTITAVAKFLSIPDHAELKLVIQNAMFKDRVQLTYKTLEFTSVKLGDAGLYSCVASADDKAPDTWLQSNVTIYVRPQNVVVSPRLDEGVTEGTLFDLKCSVQQVKPRPKIYWRIGEEGPIHNGSQTDRITPHPNGTFSVQTFYQWKAKHEDDSKWLYCIITLDGNHNEVLGKKRTRISVLYKPYGQAEISPLTLEMAEGSTDSLFCTPPSVQGNPAPSWFVWTLQNGTFLRNTSSPELKLSPAYVNESYLYQCIAGNYLGKSDASELANVTVLDAVSFRERNGPLVRGSGIVPLVVGVVLGLVLIICLVAVAIVIWKYKRKSAEAYRSGGTKSVMRSPESMPLHQSYRSDIIRDHPDAPPVSPPRKPPRTYEHSDIQKKYFKGLPTPPPTPPAPLDEDNNQNVCATTLDEDKVPTNQPVYADLNLTRERNYPKPQPRETTQYADIKFN